MSVAVRALNLSTADRFEDTTLFASPPPSRPPPAPPAQPGAVVVFQPQVLITLVAAGSVEDFDESRRTGLRTSLAAEVGVDVDDVALTVESASVRLRFDVNVATEQAAAQLVSTLSSSLSTTATASALFGITVEEAPQLEAVVTRIVLVGSPPSTPPEGEAGGMLVVGVIAGAGGGLLLAIVAVLLCRARPGKSCHPCASCPSAILSMPSATGIKQAAPAGGANTLTI